MAVACSGHQSLEMHSNSVNSCDSYADMLATGSSDKTIRLFRLENEMFIEMNVSPFCGHRFSVKCVRFNSCGSMIGSNCIGGEFLLWNTTSGKLMKRIVSTIFPTYVTAFVFSPYDYYLAVASSDRIRLLSSQTFQEVNATDTTPRIDEDKQGCLVIFNSEATTLSFTLDAQCVVAGCRDGRLEAWPTSSAPTSKHASVSDAHDMGVVNCEFSKNYATDWNTCEYLLASCGNDNTVKIWTLTCNESYSFNLKHICCAHTCSVYSCRFSPNSKVLASTGNDHKVIFWDVETGKRGFTADAHYRCAISCCAFVQDSYFVTGSLDKTILVWRLTLDNNCRLTYSPCTSDQGALLAEGSVSPRALAEASVTPAALPFTAESMSFAPPVKDIALWDLTDVERWLKEIGMAQYAPSFIKNEIDGRALIFLNHDSLQGILGIGAYGHRLKILHHLQTFKNSPQFPTSQASAATASPWSSADFYPKEFECPIRKEIMREPVVAADGFSYEREAIVQWIGSGIFRSPCTNEQFVHSMLIPNFTLHSLISSFLNK